MFSHCKNAFASLQLRRSELLGYVYFFVAATFSFCSFHFLYVHRNGALNLAFGRMQLFRFWPSFSTVPLPIESSTITEKFLHSLVATRDWTSMGASDWQIWHICQRRATTLAVTVNYRCRNSKFTFSREFPAPETEKKKPKQTCCLARQSSATAARYRRRRSASPGNRNANFVIFCGTRCFQRVLLLGSRKTGRSWNSIYLWRRCRFAWKCMCVWDWLPVPSKCGCNCCLQIVFEEWSNCQFNC